MRTTIMEQIHENPVILIRGNTGCGKTTQVCPAVRWYGPLAYTEWGLLGPPHHKKSVIMIFPKEGKDAFQKHTCIPELNSPSDQNLRRKDPPNYDCALSLKNSRYAHTGTDQIYCFYVQFLSLFRPYDEGRD